MPIVTLATSLAVAPMLAGLAIGADPIIVRPGDTLSAISRQHGVPIAEIARLNELPDPNRIFAGQRLRLEADEPSPRTPATPDTPASGPDRSHVVRAGEHLTGIARHYGVSVAAIVAANGIADPSRIYAGHRLVIPGRGATPAAPAPAAPATPQSPPSARSHVVRAGEHLTGIARHYGVSVAAIVAANGIADPSRIYAGHRLVIPGTTTASATTTAPSIPSSMQAVMAQRDDVRRLIVTEADRLGVPASLALAVAWQESGWRQNVVSHAGAIGVMQLLPATGEWVGDVMLGHPVDLRQADDNVRVGVRLLKHYLVRYDGDIDLVLAAYYQGQTAADRHGVYPVSRGYIASIRALVRMLGG